MGRDAGVAVLEQPQPGCSLEEGCFLPVLHTGPSTGCRSLQPDHTPAPWPSQGPALRLASPPRGPGDVPKLPHHRAHLARAPSMFGTPSGPHGANVLALEQPATH